MKKTLLIAVLSILILTAGLFSFIKLNPPLVSGTVAAFENNHTVVTAIANEGYRALEITDISVNSNEEPQEQYMQVSNPLLGIVVSDDYEREDAAYGIREVEDVSIVPGPSPSEQIQNVNNGTATEDDLLYGVSVIYDEPIHSVQLEYSYFGLSFDKTLSVDN